MNVLVVTNMFPTRQHVFYGCFVKEQVEALRREGVHVDVHFINGLQDRLNYFRSVGELARSLRMARYDLIHAHHSYCVYPVRIARVLARRRCPVVLTFHEGEVHWAGEKSFREGDLLKRLVFSRRVKRGALRMADFVIAVQGELLGEVGFRGEWAVIPCGVDAELFRPMDRSACRARLGLPLDKRVIFFPASPGNKQKGFDLLEEAVERLGRGDVVLLSAGNTGHEDMPFYMNAADVVAQLSVFEASPAVVKEVLATNTPLVFTDCGDARRMMDGVAGCFLCERNLESVIGALQEALNFEGKCTGRERILEGNLTLEGVSRRIIGVYERVLGIRGCTNETKNLPDQTG